MSRELDALPPPKSGARYKKIVERGCGGSTIETMDGTDYDCDYYEWMCEECPVVIERERVKYREERKSGDKR